MIRCGNRGRKCSLKVYVMQIWSPILFLVSPKRELNSATRTKIPLKKLFSAVGFRRRLTVGGVLHICVMKGIHIVCSLFRGGSMRGHRRHVLPNPLYFFKREDEFLCSLIQHTEYYSHHSLPVCITIHLYPPNFLRCGTCCVKTEQFACFYVPL